MKVLRTALVLPVIFAAVSAASQQITPANDPNRMITVIVQVLDGRRGTPLPSEAISIQCVSLCSGYKLSSDGNLSKGQIKVVVPASATELILSASMDKYVSCDGAARIPLPMVTERGFTDRNGCKTLPAGKMAKWNSTPGRVVVFLYRKSWWERLWGEC